MNSRISTISQLLLIFSAVLYLFGFITINAYLSKFGMVSFDLVNSRFIIAGFYSFISIFLMVLSSWLMAKEVPAKELVNVEKHSFGDRALLYAKFTSFIYIFSAVLNLLLSWGEAKPGQQDGVMKFHHLFGKRDQCGLLVEEVFEGKNGGLVFSMQVALNCLPYVVLLGALISLTVVMWRRYLKKEKLINKVDDVNPTPEQTVARVYIPSEFDYFSLVIDAVVLLFLGAMFLYCSNRLTHNLICFGSLNGDVKLTFNIVFCWLFSNVVVLYLFFSLVSWPNEKAKKFFDVFRIKTLGDFQNLVQQSIVPVLLALITFGQAIFPRIAFSIGGGQPREVVIKTDENIHEVDGKTFLLGESSQYFYVVCITAERAKAFQLSKLIVKSVQTKSESCSSETTIRK